MEVRNHTLPGDEEEDGGDDGNDNDDEDEEGNFDDVSDSDVKDIGDGSGNGDIYLSFHFYL